MIRSVGSVRVVIIRIVMWFCFDTNDEKDVWGLSISANVILR